MKQALIFGDSYSTFENFIPEGYATYYAPMWGGTDLSRVEETWWYSLMAENKLELVRNDSWSGSTVCYTAYEWVDCSETSSFIYRLETLKHQGFFEEHEIDTVFVFGATNDSWNETAQNGELMLSGWEKKDLYFILPAIGYFFAKLREILPKAKIYCIVNTDLDAAVTEGLSRAARAYGAKPIMLHDIDKTNNHPTVKGMAQIKEQVQSSMRGLWGDVPFWGRVYTE